MILLAPDSYKGFLSSVEACGLFHNILKKHFPEKGIVKYPVSDGGDGFLDCLEHHYGYRRLFIKMKDISENIREIPYLKGREGIFLELSEIAGIKLLQEHDLGPRNRMLDPLGRLIAKLYEAGHDNFNIGFGGSATNDFGSGILKGMGYSFRDIKNDIIEGKDTLSFLHRINSIDPSERNYSLKIKAYCDVDNKLFGKCGCTRCYGPQKGIGEGEFDEWERGGRNFLRVLSAYTKKDMVDLKHFGAAGGAVLPLYYLFDAGLESGISLFAGKKLEEIIYSSEYVITGEGKFDETSLMNKGTGEIVKIANKFNKKTLIITGKCEFSFNRGNIFVFENQRPVDTAQSAIKELSNSLYRAIIMIKGKR